MFAIVSVMMVLMVSTLGTLPTDIVGGNPMEPGCLILLPIERHQGTATGTDITTAREEPADSQNMHKPISEGVQILG